MIKNINMALSQLIFDTCANAKKYIGERKKEKGIRSSLMVESLSIKQGNKSDEIYSIIRPLQCENTYTSYPHRTIKDNARRLM